MRWWRLLALIAAGTGLGLAWNAVSGRGLALTKNALVKPGDEEIDAAEAKARQDKGALVLDARPPAYYEMEHIPKSLSLPEDDFDKAFAKLEPVLRSQTDVIVYCEAYCEASHIVARKLKERGVPAAIVKDGWSAWKDAGYPTTTGAQP